MGTGRYYLGGCGTQTAALAFGGQPATPATESYDGTSWSSEPNMISGRYHIAGAGTQTAAVAMGGSPELTLAEEFSGISPATKTITTT